MGTPLNIPPWPSQHGGETLARASSLSSASLPCRNSVEFSTERLPSATAPPAPKLAVLGTPLPRFHEVNPSSHQSYTRVPGLQSPHSGSCWAHAPTGEMGTTRDPIVPDPHTLRITRSASEPAGAYRILGLLVMRCTRRPRFRCSLLVNPKELMLPLRSASGSMVLAETKQQEEGRDVRTNGMGHLGWLNKSQGTGLRNRTSG